MILVLFYVLSSLAGTAAAIYSGKSWEDFTNNFATDIAPLITLFGEQVTKQFLSESTHILDSIIFGMAPIGILTAIVAVIRIHGGPRLKAFVGRAQEPHGIAEVELCSSTSSDVCELWSQGGICRVIGRPKILEFFHNPRKEDFYPNFTCRFNGFKLQRWGDLREVKDILGKPNDCNIYESKRFLGVKDCGWKEKTQWKFFKQENSGRSNEKFAPYPNLSLNIGFHTPHPPFLLLTSFFSFMLQSSFFGFAVIFTFHKPELYGDGEASQVWAFVLAILGTAMVVFGMVMCAYLVDQKSCERHFFNSEAKTKTISITKWLSWLTWLPCYGPDEIQDTRARASTKLTSPAEPAATTTIYWLQPGKQRVGDQLFHEFSYNEQKSSYVTSWKVETTPPQSLVVLALLPSAIGFIIQFVGLRGLHGIITLYQIAATLVMVLVRAFLRWRKDVPESDIPECDGHELDWQALDIFNNLQPGRKDNTAPKAVNGWFLCDEITDPPGIPLVVGDNFQRFDCIYQGPRHYGISAFLNMQIRDENETPGKLADAAINFTRNLEKAYANAEFNGPNSLAMIALFRARLAYLTGYSMKNVQPEWDGPVSSIARSLQLALQDLTNYAFYQSGSNFIKRRWKKAKILTWYTSGMIQFDKMTPEQQPQTSEQQSQCISFSMFLLESECYISQYNLEAVISLWAFSLRNAESLDKLVNKVLLFKDRDPTTDLFDFHRLWMLGTDIYVNRSSGDMTWVEAWDMEEQRLVSRTITPQVLSQRGVIKLRARTPPLTLLAQSLFTIFVSRIASIMSPIYLSDEQLLSVWSIGNYSKTRPLERYQAIQIPHIRAITKLFIESGLGTEDEALMCFIPVFVKSGILPGEDKMVARLVSYARQQCREKKFQEAKAVFQALFENYYGRRRYLVTLPGFLYGFDEYMKTGRLLKVGLKNERLIRYLPELAKGFREETRSIAAEFRRDTFDTWFGGFEKYIEPRLVPLHISERYFLDYLRTIDCEGNSRMAVSDLKDHLKRDEKLDLPKILRADLSSLDTKKKEQEELVSLAIRKSCPELLEDLLDKYGDKTDGTIPHGSFLIDAMESSVDLSIMETILDFFGFRFDLPSGSGDDERSTKFLGLALEKQRADIALLLIERGLPIDGLTLCSCANDENLWTLEPQDTQKILTLLLEQVNKVIDGGHFVTAYERAFEVGNLETIRILLEWVMPSDVIVFEAIQLGDRAILREVLNCGVAWDINAAGPHGTTPLFEAVKRVDFDKEIVEILCQAGADPRKPNREGATEKLCPLEKCREMGQSHHELLELLEKHLKRGKP